MAPDTMPFTAWRNPWFCMSRAERAPARWAPIEIPTPSSSSARRMRWTSQVSGRAEQIETPAPFRASYTTFELASETGIGGRQPRRPRRVKRGNGAASGREVVLGGGGAGGGEDAEEAEGLRAGAGQAVGDPGREEDARAGADRENVLVDLDGALAVQDVDGLLVGVAVGGRGDGLDGADELRHGAASDGRIDQDPEGPAGAGLERLLVLLPDPERGLVIVRGPSRILRGGDLAFRSGPGRRGQHGDHDQIVRPVVLQAVLDPGGHEERGPR